MYRDVSSCNTYNYGDALYWNARYVQEGGSFDWYQRYSALRPFVRKYIPTSSRVLMVGCGNAHLQMDVRDMSFFEDESFDAVIDKGTLDSLMCGTNAPISASQMLGEVSRLLKPRGIYMLITYGDPKARMIHLKWKVYNWKIELYIIARPGFEKPGGCSSSMKSSLEPVPITDDGQLPAEFVLEDPDSHFIYVCKKMNDMDENHIPSYTLKGDIL
ncbi:methyltransferase 11 domain-containing protein [Citrus sinensis]|uniref:Methyltransferase type 11 domain-containing protein n=1 Tax=Citrus clementina TaxID=85681 RepID=V4SWB2_CITCL|nr:hypothetical protein CICLE_v10032531mg [Citrus x clementina]KAH9709983.1 methyltransferase 11 domain-containing protein [Citrus sinensis]